MPLLCVPNRGTQLLITQQEMKITNAEKTWHLDNKEGIYICRETNPLEEKDI